MFIFFKRTILLLQLEFVTLKLRNNKKLSIRLLVMVPKKIYYVGCYMSAIEDQSDTTEGLL